MKIIIEFIRNLFHKGDYTALIKEIVKVHNENEQLMSEIIKGHKEFLNYHAFTYYVNSDRKLLMSKCAKYAIEQLVKEKVVDSAIVSETKLASLYAKTVLKTFIARDNWERLDRYHRENGGGMI